MLIDSEYKIDEILYVLQKLKCPYRQAKEAYETLNKRIINFGFTYANYSTAQAFIFIGPQDNILLLINTIAHESRHLQLYISEYYNLDLRSEQVCYLLGSIVQKIYSVCIDNHII